MIDHEAIRAILLKMSELNPNAPDFKTRLETLQREFARALDLAPLGNAIAAELRANWDTLH
jgi:hypothetical protein